MSLFAVIVIAILISICVERCLALQWIPHDAYTTMLAKFDMLEKQRNDENIRGTDMRPSTPFITGNGFRAISPHICDDMNRCRVSTETIKNGSCIFIKTDLFEMFVINILPNIPGTYRLISHNGDLSAPDGQDDAPRIGMPRYVVSNILAKEYASGKLIAHHGQNLWWKNYTFSSRPEWSHCLPIGFENRQWKIGKNVGIYAEAIRSLILSKPIPTQAELDARPLLLIAFYPKSRCPDRQKVLSIIGALPPRGQQKPVNPWYNETDLNHAEWLEGIVTHKFVLAPFGHGLDTHRYCACCCIECKAASVADIHTAYSIVSCMCYEC